MGFVISIGTPFKTKISRIKHKMFDCPTFWRLKPAFKCPICSTKYRCYWDGCDAGGYIDLCKTCATKVGDK